MRPCVLSKKVCLFFIGLWLISAVAFAATSVTNNATIAPPAGVTEISGGCDNAVPPNCTGNNTSTLNVPVWTALIEKTANPANAATVLAGQTISYTLVATVSGSATTSATVFTDTLSAGQTFASVTSPGVFIAGGSGQVHTFTLPAGTAVGSYAVTYTATVNAAASGTLTNSVTGGGGCNPSASCTTSHPVGSISLAKVLTSESGVQAGVAEAGETLNYSITLTNPSSVAVTGYNLTDTRGAGLTYVSSSNGGVNAGLTTTWTGLTIPANSALVVTLVTTVNTPIATTSVSNLAKPTGDPDPACPSTACVVTPTSSTVTIAKTANPASGATVIAGQTISYTLTATVTGATTSVATVFTDTLSSGQTFGSVTTPGVFTAGGAGQARTFTLPAGTAAGTYAVTYTATVDAGASGTLTNSVTGGNGCTASSVCTTSHPAGSVGLAKVLLTESGSQAGIAEAGETLTYRITLTNPSTAAVTGYNLTDTLGAGLSFVSASNGGVNAGQAVTWTGLTVPASGSLQITVVATVNAPLTTASVSNLTKPTGNPDPTCPSTTCVVTPTSSTVTIAKTANPVSGATVIAGQTISYTLTATVTGASTSAPTVFTDTLSAGQTFDSVVASGGFTAGGAGQVRTFTLPAGMAAGSYSVTYTVTVNAGASGTLTNSVTGGGGCTPSLVCTTSHPIGSVSITKVLSSESGVQAGIAEAGETLTYSITLANPSATNVTGYNLADTLSAGLSFVSASNGGVHSGQTINWTSLTVPASGNLVLTVVTTVNTPVTSASVSNLAKPSGNPDPTCPSAACVVTPTTSTVTIAKTSNPAPGSTVIAGQTLSYTLTATVTGAATSAPTVFTDTLSAGQTFGSVTTPGIFTAGGAGQVRTFTLPSGTAAGTYAVTYSATVNAGASGTLNNSVTGGGGCTPSAVCSTDHPVGAVTVAKAIFSESGVSVGVAEPGETITYRITLTNPSAVAVTGYNLTDTRSTGLTFVSATNGGVNSGLTTTWTGLTVPANGTLQVTVVVTVNTPVITPTVSNLAKPTGSPDPACPSAACVVSPTDNAVTIAKTSNPATGSTVIAGQAIAYTLTATVTGSATAAPTVFTDTLSAGQTFGSVTTPGIFTAGGAGQTRTFTLPAGTVAGTYAVTYSVSVDVGATGSVSNSVTGGNGCTPSTVCATTHPVGSVTVTKALSAESGTQAGIAEAGETLSYSITLANPSTVAVTGYNLSDTMGAGLTFVSATNGGINAAQNTTWTGLTVPAGGSLVIGFVATVNTPLAGTSVRNLAKPTGDPDPTCPSAACVVTPTGSNATIAKTSNPGTGATVVAGQTIAYTLTATVTGSATTAPAVFTDTLSAGQTFDSVTAPGGFTAGGAGQVRTFTLPTGTTAGTYTLTYTATVNTGASGTLTNNVTGGGGCTPSLVCTTSHPVGSVTVTKTLSAESGVQAGLAEAGESLTYSITLTNPTTVPIVGYSVSNMTDSLGAGLTFVSASNGGVRSGQTVNWVNLSVPANGSLVLSIVATVDAPITSASLSNLAKPTGDPDPACPSAACVVTPTTSTVTIAKVSNPASGATVLAGQSLSYTLTATVTGSATAAPTVFTDTLSAGQTFGSVTTPGIFTAGGAGQVRTFTLPAGTAAGTYTVTYTATVDAGASGTLTNSVTGGAGCTPLAVCSTNHPVGSLGLTKALASESGSLAGVAEVNETLTYRITLTNPSAVAVTGYNLTDTRGTGLNFVSATNSGVNAGQTTTWTGLTVPANSSLQVMVVTTVAAPITTANVSNLAKPTGNPDPACPSAACVVTPTNTAVTIAKTATPATAATVVPGQTISYTLTTTVTGSATSTTTVFTDTLSSGQTFGSVTAPGVFTAGGAGQVRTFTLPAGTAAGTYAVTYSATVNAGATGTLNNSVTGGNGCTPASVCSTDHPVGSITITKALASESGAQTGIAEAGETLTYTVTLANPSPSAVSGYNLTDTMGPGLTFVSATNGGVNAGQTTTWTGLTVPGAGSLVVTVLATVNGPITSISVRNLAKPTGNPDPACPSAACVVTPTSTSVTISKTSNVGGAIVIAGQTIQYTLTATVTGSATTAPTVFTDTLSANLVFDSVVTPGIFVAGGSGQVRTFTLPTGTTPGVYTTTYAVRVRAGAAGTVNNVVLGGGGCTPSTTCTTSDPVNDISLVKALVSESGTLPGVAEANEILTYSITITNPTGTPANYDLTDTTGVGLTFVSASNGGVNTGQNTTWTGLVIPANGSLVVTFVARVDAPVTGSAVFNQVRPTGDPSPPLCPSTRCVVTPTTSSITVSKSSVPASGSQVLFGQTITYTITATVTGSPTSSGTVFTDTLSAGQTYGSVTTPGVFSAGGSGQVRSFTLPSGTAPGIYSMSYTATVNPGATGLLNNAVNGGAGCTTPGGCTTTHTLGLLNITKTLLAESGSLAGVAEPGETLTYQIQLANPSSTQVTGYSLVDTLSAGLSFVSASNGGANAGTNTTWSGLTVPANGSLSLTLAATVQSPITTAKVSNLVKPPGAADPACPSATCVETPTVPTVHPVKRLTSEDGTRAGLAEAGETLGYTITFTNVGGTAFQNYRFVENVPSPVTLTSVTGASGFGGPVTGPSAVTLTVPQIPAGGSATVNVYFRVLNVPPSDATEVVNLINGGDVDPACGANCRVATPLEQLARLSILKSSSVREAKIGDLVRYTVRVSNIGTSNLVKGRIVDTPPPGFSYVANSMAVVDDDNAYVLGPAQTPLDISAIDIAQGKQAVITYMLRVGAGVRQGVKTNQVRAYSPLGIPISDIATADVSIVADPLVDDSLILGTVFDDRDGDGWQDPASLSDVKVRGGFAPGAYMPNSTVVDRGQGPEPLPDASAPLLHGVTLGSITARQSEADPAKDHQVSIRQRLRALDFTDDFILTNAQGVTVRMDAKGQTTVEKSGDAAKGLNGAEPVVERRVAQVDGGFEVEYQVRNRGIDERGIPGVRVASVEGYLIETDQYGRYHLAQISGGEYARGRNFILKVDPSTLPVSAEFTTPNPLLRRITPGLPVRFDFGVKMPVANIGNQQQQLDLLLGEVFFAPGQATLRAEYQPVIASIAAKLDEYGAGELAISANGETHDLALARVQAVRDAVLPMVKPSTASQLRVVSRTTPDDSSSLVVGVAPRAILLGTVLFDTDKAVVKPAFESLLTKIAAELDRTGGGVVQIIGHADMRGAGDYNLALGMRRARAVFDALANKLKAETRQKVRVEIQGPGKDSDTKATLPAPQKNQKAGD